MFKKNKKVEKTPKSADAQEISPELAYEGWYRESLHTGSRVICSPPPDKTDDDYLFLVNRGSIAALEEKLKKDGFVSGGSFGDTNLAKREDPEDFSNFASYRNGDYNVILTCNDDYFSRFSNATRLAKKLNLLKKEDRVTLFEAVVRDEYPKEKVEYNWGTVIQRIRVPIRDWQPLNGGVNPPVVMAREVGIDEGRDARILAERDRAILENGDIFVRNDAVWQVDIEADRAQARAVAGVDRAIDIVEARQNALLQAQEIIQDNF